MFILNPKIFESMCKNNSKLSIEIGTSGTKLKLETGYNGGENFMGKNILVPASGPVVSVHPHSPGVPWAYTNQQHIAKASSVYFCFFFF